MADDKFSLGDILWEYADYTPPAATPATVSYTHLTLPTIRLV